MKNWRFVNDAWEIPVGDFTYTVKVKDIGTKLDSKTGQEMQLRDPFHPRANIYAGTRYLRILANQFDGDIRKTIAGYNAGPGAVRRAGGVPNFPETQVYVQRVLKLYRHYLNQAVFD